jgi:hypothetical protein
MCGRTSCHLPRDVLTRACAYRDPQGQLRLPRWRDPDQYRPSYNQSPQARGPVLLSRLHVDKVTTPSFTRRPTPLARRLGRTSWQARPVVSQAKTRPVFLEH